MHINSALQVDLSFVSLNKNVLKNLGHWLGLSTTTRGIHASVPLWDIVATAFNRSPQDLLFILPFVTWFLYAGSCGSLFQPLHPHFKTCCLC